MDLKQKHNHLGVKYVKFSTDGERESRDFFISEVNKAIKKIQHLATSVESKPVNNEDWQFQNLIERLDHVFLHGLKNYIKGYLVVFKEFIHPSVLKELSSLKRIATDIGISRAWLLHGLKDHLLESYLQCLMTRRELVSRYYYRNSIFFDSQKIELLIALLSGLEHIKFDLQLDIGHLDLYCYNKELKQSIASEDAESDRSCPITKVTRDNSEESCDTFTPDTITTVQQPQATLVSSSSSSSFTSSPMPTGETVVNNSNADVLVSNADDTEALVEHIPPKRKKRKNKTTSMDKDNSSTSSDSTVSSTVLDAFPIKAEMEVAKVDISADKSLAVPDVIAAYQPVRQKSKEASFFEEQFEKIVFGRLLVDRKTESVREVLKHENNNDSSIENAVKPSFNKMHDAVNVSQHDVSNKEVSLYSHSTTSTSVTNDCTDGVGHCVLHEKNPVISRNYDGEQQDQTDFALKTVDPCCLLQENCGESTFMSSDGRVHGDGGDDDNDYESVYESVETVKDLSVDDVGRYSPAEENIKFDNSRNDSDDTDFGNNIEEAEERTEDAVVDDDDEDVDPHSADYDYRKEKDAECSLEYKVSNNLKVLFLLDIFTIDGETLVKAFEVYQHFTDGKPRPHLVVIASSSVYFFTLKVVNGIKKIKLHFHILYSNLASLSIGLNGQTIDFVLKSKFRYNICTRDPHLTRMIVEELKRAIEQCQGQGKVTILSDSTNQKIAIKRWAGNLYPNLKAKLATIESYNLVSYHIRSLISPTNSNTPQTNNKIKKGNLSILAQVQHMHGIVPMWKKAFFVLRDKFLYEYEDETLSTKTSTINLSEWSDCRRCDKLSGKKHCFVLLSSPSHSSSSKRNDRRLIASKKDSMSPQLMPLISFLSPLLSIPHNLPSPANKKRALPLPSVPSVYFSLKTKEEAKDWTAALKSVIKSLKDRESENRLKHGCCILINNALHICHQNPTTCAIQILTFFSLNDIISVTRKGKSLTLVVDAKGLCDFREEFEPGFEMLELDKFEILSLSREEVNNVDDVQKVGLVQSLKSPTNIPDRAICLESGRAVTGAELDGHEKKLVDIFFCTSEESLKFVSTLKSCFSTVSSSRELDEVFKELGDEDDILNSLLKELDDKFETRDWNSAEGFEASLK